MHFGLSLSVLEHVLGDKADRDRKYWEIVEVNVTMVLAQTETHNAAAAWHQSAHLTNVPEEEVKIENLKKCN